MNVFTAQNKTRIIRKRTKIQILKFDFILLLTYLCSVGKTASLLRQIHIIEAFSFILTLKIANF